MLEIRSAVPEDLEQIAALEAKCFPEAEAASKDALSQRLQVYPSHFWLLERDGKLVSMVNGMASNSDELTDAMYQDASLHEEDGNTQMLFGVATDPDFRKKGYACILMKEVIKDCINDSRRQIVLHCKDELLPFYEKLGFVKEDEAHSDHGGAHWNRMVLNLEKEI